jgi:hypothetical protein
MNREAFVIPTAEGKEQYIHSFSFPTYLLYSFSIWAPSKTLELFSKSFGYEYQLAISKKRPLTKLFSYRNLENKATDDLKLRYTDILKNYGGYIGFYKEMMKFGTEVITNHFFIRWFIPLQSLVYALVINPNPIDIGFSLYLILGRSKLLQSIDSDVIKKLEVFKRGFEKEKKLFGYESVQVNELKFVEQLMKDNSITDEEKYKRAWKFLEKTCFNESIIKAYWAMTMDNDVRKVRDQPVATLFEIEKKDLVTKLPEDKKFDSKKHKAKKIEFIPKKDFRVFDYRMPFKTLAEINEYNQLHNFIVDSLKNGGIEWEEIPVYETKEGTQTCFAVGNKKAKYKVVIGTGHEDEIAGAYSIAQMLKSLATVKGVYTDEILDKFLLYFIPSDYPPGFNRRAWNAVDLNSNVYSLPRSFVHGMFKEALIENNINVSEFLTPLLMEFNPFQLNVGRGKMVRDENGVWGDVVKAEFIAHQQAFLKQIAPIDVLVDLHETTGYRDEMTEFVYGDCGILLIVDAPEIDANYDKVYKAVRKTPMLWSPTNVFSKIRNAEKILGKYGFYKICKDTVKYMNNLKVKTVKGEQQRMLELPQIYPFIIPIGQAMSTDGPMFKDSDIILKSSWSIKNLGARMAITTETFPQSLDNEGGLFERMRQDLYFIEGLLLNIMKTW